MSSDVERGGPRHERVTTDGGDPSLALFARWDAEDATDDPEEMARRQRDGDELLAALEKAPLALRLAQLPDTAQGDD